MQVYNLISSLKTHQLNLHFTPLSLDVFICVPFQLHGEHTVLQPFRRIELILHIAVSVISGSFYTWVNWSMWGESALPKYRTWIECPNIERGETFPWTKRGCETARQVAKLQALTISPRSSQQKPTIQYTRGGGLWLLAVKTTHGFHHASIGFTVIKTASVWQLGHFEQSVGKRLKYIYKWKTSL